MILLLPVAVHLLFASFPRPSLQTNAPPAKCCDEHSQIRELNSALECVPKSNLRHQVLAGARRHFLQRNKSEAGECIDSDGEEFFLYRVGAGEAKLASKTPNPETPFPKCCPLGHVYGFGTRSCSVRANVTTVAGDEVEGGEEEEDFIKGSFVRVGLPKCKMILDRKYDNIDDLNAVSAIEDKEDGTFCLDKTEAGGFVMRVCQANLDICKTRRCLKKCCPDGQSYVGGGFCKDTFVHGVKIVSQRFSDDIEDPTDDFELIYGAACPRVFLLAANPISYRIDKNGVFRYYHNYSKSFVEENYSFPRSYCIEHASKGHISGYHVFNCYGSKGTMQDKFKYTLWAKITSCIFLFVTILLYIVLGETKSTFGKILVSYCSAMMLLMFTLTVAHIHLEPSRLECKLTGYMLLLFSGASFAWLNVMSLDIWWTFGTPKRVIGSDQRRRDLKKFLFYNLYGWGVPISHMCLILIFAETQTLPDVIQPYVGVYFCFLENRNYSRLVFLHIPQLIFQMINTVLFLKTIVYCIRVKNEINKMNDTGGNTAKNKFTADKEKLGLIIKLAVIMGIIWIFEVTSAFFDLKSYSKFTKILEIFMDNITCLQGVFIFIIFICKKKTFTGIKTKMGLGERRISCSTSISQSNHAVAPANGRSPMNKSRTNASINESRI